MTTSPALLELDGLEVSLGGRTVLDRLNGRLSGRVVGLLGPNGAGKTTLLATLLGFHRPRAGSARILGRDITADRIELKTRLGYMPESDAYIAHLTAVRFVRMMAELSGLPPLLIHAGEAEILVDQIRKFAARAQAAGVDVELSVYPDMVHVWHMFRGVTPEAQRAIDEIGAFVRKHAG